jgi:hypothetical protein
LTNQPQISDKQRMGKPLKPVEVFEAQKAEFIRIISEGGTLYDVARNLKCDVTTPLRWLREDQTGELRKEYMRAREDQGDLSADNITELGRKVARGELDPQAGRVAIDSEKWIAGRRKPKVYGDRLQTEISGPDGGAIVTDVREVSSRDLARAALLLVAQAQTEPESE